MLYSYPLGRINISYRKFVIQVLKFVILFHLGTQNWVPDLKKVVNEFMNPGRFREFKKGSRQQLEKFERLKFKIINHCAIYNMSI